MKRFFDSTIIVIVVAAIIAAIITFVTMWFVSVPNMNTLVNASALLWVTWFAGNVMCEAVLSSIYDEGKADIACMLLIAYMLPISVEIIIIGYSFN